MATHRGDRAGAPADRADARLPRLPRARARAVAQHARGVPLRPPAVRRVPGPLRPRPARGAAERPGRVRLRAGRRPRGQAAGRAGDAAAQDRLPALVLPPPAPRADPRPRPDRRAAPAALPRPPAEGAQPRRGAEPARAAARQLAGALRDRALLETMYACGLRASEAIGLKLSRPRPRGGHPARPRQGVQGADRPDRQQGDRDAPGLPRARPPEAGRSARRAARVRQPPRRRPLAPGPLQDRPAARPHRRARATDEPAHAAPHVRHPPARRRLRPALAAGDARARRHRHDPDLHAPVGRPAARRLLRRASARADRPRGRRVRAWASRTSTRPSRSAPRSATSRRLDATSERRRVGHVGVSRLQVPDGCWSTPAHEHGREEEIFYVLGGRGLVVARRRHRGDRRGRLHRLPPEHGAHTLHGLEGLDVLAFGTRFEDESPRFPRLGLSRVGNRAVETMPGSMDGDPDPVDPRGRARPARAARRAGGAPVDDRQRRRRRAPARSSARGSRGPGATSGGAAGRSTPASSTSRSRPASSPIPCTATRSRRSCSWSSAATASLVARRGGDPGAGRARRLATGRDRRRAHVPRRRGRADACSPTGPASPGTSATTRARTRSPSGASA